MNMTSVFAPIEKSIDQEDGSVLVYGKATDGSLDRDQQRCDPSWLNEAMPAWYRTGGNVREQHDARRAVGKAIEHEIAEDGHYVTARIVDPVAVAKTRAGVFTGFSIGIRNPKIAKSADAANGVINGGEIVELSLCDRPANPECLITLVKAAEPGMEINSVDFDEERGLVKCEELVEKAAEDAALDFAEQAAAEVAEQAGEGDVAKSTNWAAEASAAALDGATGCGCCNECICSETGTKAADVDVEKAAEAPEFDRDAAKALVAETIAKADSGVMPPEYADEQSDSQNAMAAISIISKLIVSEAQEMCDNPAEDCDIHILLNAVAALRCFIGREQQQSMGENDVNNDSPEVVLLTAYADTVKAKYSAEQLRQMLKDGKAMKNPAGEPSYPIGDKEDLENAIHAVGRGSGDHGAIRAYIKRRAAALGASNMIPDDWKSGSSKAAESEEPATEIESAEAEVAEKTAEPETTKAATVADEPDGEALVKALSAALEKADNPLRKSFEAIVEASTEAVAKSVSELAERLVQVEQMAVPGGPAQRRTEVERKEARKADLLAEAAKYKSLAKEVDNRTVRKGYLDLAARAEAGIAAL